MMVVIRPFSPADTDAVHQIAADTALYGAPVEAIFEDRRLFIDVFMRPYTMYYPDLCWIADVGGLVVGYLTGCLDTTGYKPRFQRALVAAAGRALRGYYRLGPRTVRAGIGLVREMFSHRTRPDLAPYPAHLHINLAAVYRGQGIGRRLITAYLDQCRAVGVTGVHLSTTDQNATAVHLYHKMGFVILHRYRSPYQSMVSGRPVHGIIMGLTC
jgi:ribosomal protein S18 acetylase RimI-like enzyme